MATPIAIPGVVGAEIRTIRSRPATAKAHQAIRIVPRNPAHQAGEGKKGAVAHRPSAAQTEAGDPSRRVLVAGPVAVEAEGGADALEAVATAGEIHVNP